MTNDLRILLVSSKGEQVGSMADILSEDLHCTVDSESFARDVVLNRDPHKYNVAIIHALDDLEIGKFRSLSEWLKIQNPEILIIGMSAMGVYVKKDYIAGKRYDIRLDSTEVVMYGLKSVLEKYGFEFPEAVEVTK